MSPIIIDRGHGPEIAGTRITVYRIMDYVPDAVPPDEVAQELGLSIEQVQAALDYIATHRILRVGKLQLVKPHHPKAHPAK